MHASSSSFSACCFSAVRQSSGRPGAGSGPMVRGPAAVTRNPDGASAARRPCTARPHPVLPILGRPGRCLTYLAFTSHVPNPFQLPADPRRAPPRMLPPHRYDPRLHQRAHVMRTRHRPRRQVRQSAQPLSAYQRNHECQHRPVTAAPPHPVLPAHPAPSAATTDRPQRRDSHGAKPASRTECRQEPELLSRSCRNRVRKLSPRNQNPDVQLTGSKAQSGRVLTHRRPPVNESAAADPLTPISQVLRALPAGRAGLAARTVASYLAPAGDPWRGI